MKSAIVLLWLCAVLVFAAASARGEEPSFVVRLTSPKLIEAEPGKIVTASYIVVNNTDQAAELVEGLTLPVSAASWQSIMAFERSIALAPRGQELRFAAFVVPVRCPPGTYRVAYVLSDRAAGIEMAREWFDVVVLPVMKVDAIVEERPTVVVAGEEYAVRMRIVNGSNSAVTMRVTATGSPEYPVRVEPQEPVLESGAATLVACYVKTRSDLEARANHILNLSVRAEAPDREGVTVTRNVFVEVLPRVLAAVDMRQRVPTQARFIALGNRRERALQVEYAGSGSLDESGSRRVDFLLRGPDTQGRTVYGMRDMMRFEYADPRIVLRLGDGSYAFSALSERLVFGRGVQTSLRAAGGEAGVLYLKTRWDERPKEDFGAYASWEFAGSYLLRANYLNKQREGSASDGGYDEDIVTLEARVKRQPFLNLGVEYGVGAGTSAGDFAHRVTVDGSLARRLFYTAENTYARPGFRGYYNDVLHSSGSAVIAARRGTRATLSYRLYETNLDRSPARGAAPRELSLRGLISCPIAGGVTVSLDYESLHSNDLMPEASFDAYEDIVRLGLGRSFRSFGVQTYMEHALRDNRASGSENEHLSRFSAYLYARPASRLSLSCFGRFGHNDLAGGAGTSANFGVSSAITLWHSSRLNVNYQNNNPGSGRGTVQHHLLSTLDLRMPFGHSISIRARWFRFEEAGDDDISFWAAYAVPLGIPALPRRSFGAIEGIVRDYDRPGAPPIQNVILTVDKHSTVTDDRGRFVFPSLPPGSHAISLDQRSMGMGRVATAQFPLAVEVEGGKIARCDMGVMTGAGIKGRVVLCAAEPAANRILSDSGESGLYVTGTGEASAGPIDPEDFVEIGGCDQVLVELTNGEETLRQRTNGRGEFSFTGLRPGVWRLRIYGESLPPQHVLERSEFEIDLERGQTREIVGRIVPRLRSVKMIDRGNIR